MFDHMLPVVRCLLQISRMLKKHIFKENKFWVHRELPLTTALQHNLDFFEWQSITFKKNKIMKSNWIFFFEILKSVPGPAGHFSVRLPVLW